MSPARGVPRAAHRLEAHLEDEEARGDHVRPAREERGGARHGAALLAHGREREHARAHGGARDERHRAKHRGFRASERVRGVHVRPEPRRGGGGSEGWASGGGARRPRARRGGRRAPPRRAEGEGRRRRRRRRGEGDVGRPTETTRAVGRTRAARERATPPPRRAAEERRAASRDARSRRRARAGPSPSVSTAARAPLRRVEGRGSCQLSSSASVVRSRRRASIDRLGRRWFRTDVVTGFRGFEADEAGAVSSSAA